MLVEKDGVKITAAGFGSKKNSEEIKYYNADGIRLVQDESKNSDELHGVFYLENNSDKKADMSMKDVSVNGLMLHLTASNGWSTIAQVLWQSEFITG